MKTIVCTLALVAAALVSGTAVAQTANAAAGAQSGSASQSGSQSGAQAVINMPTNPADTTSTITSTARSTIDGTQTQNVNYSGSQTIRNVPGVVVSGPASGPCNGFSGGLGFAGPGFGVGLNTSTVDPGCSARETARVAALMGRMDVANAVLENMPIVKEALAAKNPPAAAPKAEAPAPAPAAASDAGQPTGAGVQAVAITARPESDLCIAARAQNDVVKIARVCK